MKTAPQVATQADRNHWKNKRAFAICQLYRNYYNENRTIDDICQLIAKHSDQTGGLSASSIKTAISGYRRAGVPIPKPTRKPRGESELVTLAVEELSALWASPAK